MSESKQVTRGYFEILRDLFFASNGKNGKARKSALEQYARVRHTQYELELWQHHGLTLSQVDEKAKACFSEEFLYGKGIREVDSKTLNAAFEKLNQAVKSGCRDRCTQLMQELNQVMASNGLKTVNINEFLDFMTFKYKIRDDGTGHPMRKPGYSFEIRDFMDEYYRKYFREEIQMLQKTHRMMAVQDILKIVIFKMENSKVLIK